MLKGFFPVAAGLASVAAGFARFTRFTGCAAGFAIWTLTSVAFRADSSDRPADHDATYLRSWSFIASACSSASTFRFFSSSVGTVLIAFSLLANDRQARRY